VSQSQAKRNHGDSANMDTQLRHAVTQGCHSVTNYVYMRYFFEAHTFLRMKHASFGNCGSTIPCTCVGSERFFHIFITIIFVFSKQVLRELENAALATTRHSHCSCSGPVRLIRSKACSGEYRGLLRLCAFTRLRKAIISFVMSVCSFIHTEQFASHWMDFHEI